MKRLTLHSLIGVLGLSSSLAFAGGVYDELHSIMVTANKTDVADYLNQQGVAVNPYYNIEGKRALDLAIESGAYGYLRAINGSVAVAEQDLIWKHNYEGLHGEDKSVPAEVVADLLLIGFYESALAVLPNSLSSNAIGPITPAQALVIGMDSDNPDLIERFSQLDFGSFSDEESMTAVQLLCQQGKVGSLVAVLSEVEQSGLFSRNADGDDLYAVAQRSGNACQIILNKITYELTN